MDEYERDRSALTALHFAQDAMREHERETLHIAERMMARLDAVLALHTPTSIPPDPKATYPRELLGYDICAQCIKDWPCPTRRAIEENNL